MVPGGTVTAAVGAAPSSGGVVLPPLPAPSRRPLLPTTPVAVCQPSDVASVRRRLGVTCFRNSSDGFDFLLTQIKALDK